MGARALAEQANDVFVMSNSFIRIKELIDDESSDINDISDVIMLDPGLTATVLKLANSSFFNYPGKIDTISKAMLVLGITEVYNLVIAYFTHKAFEHLQADEAFIDDFWERSVDCALIVKYIGCAMSIPKAERLFIFGLLHNIGELVVNQFSAQTFSKYQLLSNKQNFPALATDVQMKLFDFSFAECSAELLKFWGLPFCIIEPILYQDEQNFEYLSQESKLLFLSKRIALQQRSELPIEKFITQEQQESMGITQQLLENVSRYCDVERLSILALINPGAAMIY